MITTTRMRNEPTNAAPDYIYDNCEWWKLTDRGIIEGHGEEAKQICPDIYERVQIDWPRFCADLKRRAVLHKKFCRKAYPKKYAQE